MGCDGGTIPTRDELVRLKKKPEQKDKDADLGAKWKCCALSQEPLQRPIVACQLGRLYNKDSVIELLLDRSKFEGASGFEHLKGLKDVKELSLTENRSYSTKADKGGAYVDYQAAPYICPITGLEMSGRYRFCYLLDCGCVFSDRALKAVKSATCNKCGKSYKEADVIVMNGTEEEVGRLEARMEERKLHAKLQKKAKKKKAESTVPCPDEAEGTSKKVKFDASVKDTSGSSNAKLAAKLVSKLTNGTSDKPKAGQSKTKGREVKPTNIQEDPKASSVYKSLFTSSDACKNQPKAHWVTHNPCYY